MPPFLPAGKQDGTRLTTDSKLYKMRIILLDILVISLFVCALFKTWFPAQICTVLLSAVKVFNTPNNTRTFCIGLNGRCLPYSDNHPSS